MSNEEAIRFYVFMAHGMPIDYIIHNVECKLSLYKKNKTEETFSELNAAYLLLHLKRDIEVDGLELATKKAKETLNTAQLIKAMQTKVKMN